MEGLSANVRPYFLRAGWTPGRKRVVSSSVPCDHPAFSILQGFSGLTVGRTGRGEECARSDIKFSEQADDEEVRVIWDRLLRTKLIGIADVHHSHGVLFIDASGRCFGSSIVHDAFYFEGDNFNEAAERMLLGRRSRPMLRPDQEKVCLYGETFTRQHTAVFHY